MKTLKSSLALLAFAILFGLSGSLQAQNSTKVQAQAVKKNCQLPQPNIQVQAIDRDTYVFHFQLQSDQGIDLQQFSVHWAFGDGNYDLSAKAVHTFKALGSYKVTQTLIGHGCPFTKSASTTVEVGKIEVEKLGGATSRFSSSIPDRR